MKKRILLVCMCLAMLPMNFAYAEGKDKVELYVSVSGSDDNDGSLEKPLASLAGAKARVRELNNGSSDIVVNFREGEYRVDSAMNFTAEDSGSEGAKITYKSYDGEKVTFVGHTGISSNGFKPVTDPDTLARIPMEGRGKVGQLSLKSYNLDFPDTKVVSGAEKYNQAPYPWLFVNDSQQTLARYPNKNFATVPEKPIVGGNNKEATFKFDDDRIERWATAEEAYLDGYPGATWGYEQSWVTFDIKNRTISTVDPMQCGVSKGQRWRMNNLLEEIDMPGEYYIDKKNEMLYYYPAYTLKDAELEIVLFADDVITIDGASNIEFSGLSFDKLLGTVFTLNNSSYIAIKDCSFTNIGRRAITGVSVETVIDGCDFENIGANCVYLEGGDRTTLTSSNNMITNNVMTRFCQENLGGWHCVLIRGVGCTIEYNTINNGPLGAIRFFGNDHKISHNEVYDVCKTAMDVGAIYCGSNWTERGNEISYNYIHDIRSYMGGSNCIGIYLDDQYCGVNIKNNVIVNSTMGMLIGGGRDNIIKDNILAECTQGITYDNRGEGWQANQKKPGGNIYNKLAQVPYNEEPYLTRYPELATLLENQPGTPVGMNVSGNMVYENQTGSSFAKSAVSNAVYYEAPTEIFGDSFVDAENGDFRIREGAEILASYPGLADCDQTDSGATRTEGDCEIGEFKLIYPKNGEFNINNTEYLFICDKAPNANRYRFMVAEDPEMKNIVFDEISQDNTLVVSGLETGYKKLYWKVIAENTASKWGSEKPSKGAPYLIQTSEYDILDKTRLQEIIALLETGVVNIKEGSGPAEFVDGTKKLVQDNLDKAKELDGRLKVTQKEIDQMVVAIENMMNNLHTRSNLYFTGVDNMYESSSDWKGSSLKIEPGKSVTLPAGAAGRSSFTKEFAPKDKVMSFRMNLDNWGNYIMFSMRQSEPDVLCYNAKNSYFVSFKTGVIEMQKVTPTKRGIVMTATNSFVKEGEWHDIDIGAIDCGIGVRLVLMVDGQTAIDYFDWEHTYRDDGYFTLATTNATQQEAMMPRTEIPEPIMGYSDSGSVALEEVAFDETVTDDMAARNMVIKETAANTTLKFKTMLDDLSKTHMITYRQKDASPVDGGDAYALEINKDVVMLVRYKTGKKQYLAILDNTIINSGMEHDIEIDNYRTNDGVKSVIRVDGENVIEYVDEKGIYTKGFVGVYSAD